MRILWILTVAILGLAFVGCGGDDGGEDENSCTPSCSGKECGDDGCGGTCGTCSDGKTCDEGNCVGGATLSCDEGASCFFACANDDACEQGCLDQVEGTAAATLGVLVGCMQSKCGDAATMTEVNLCTEDNCLAGYLDCMGVECASHEDCTDAEIPYCAGGMCSVAYGRTYWLDIGSAEVTDHDPADDETWDILGGAPDAYVEVVIDGEVVLTTSTDEDTFSPIWKEGLNVEIWENTDVEIRVWDEDQTTNDWIGGFPFDPVPIEVLLQGGQNFEINADGLISIEMGFLTPVM